MKRILLLLLIFSQGYLQLQAQQTVGLFLNDSMSVNGYTLFSIRNNTYLIDNCGYLVNFWESDYSSNSGVYLLENGELLRSCRVPGNFAGGGIGGRIERMSWDGELLWSYNYATPEYHQHHDIEPLPNGNVLILAWEKRTETEAIEAGKDPEKVTSGGIWPEQIVEVEMVGTDEINVVWEWYVWDHLVQDLDPTLENFGVVADHPELIDINYDLGPANILNSPDWIHANAVTYHPELDQIAISSRHFSEIWVIDHSTTTEDAAGHTGGTYGKGGDLLYRWGNPRVYDRGGDDEQTLWGQHHITWVREEDHPHYGKMMAFNNGAGRPDGPYSSVDIWTPPTDGNGNYTITDDQPFGPDVNDWSYFEAGFFSQNVSGAHSLPGGNVLICEGVEGRFFEVTPTQQVVWEYINPVSGASPVAQGQPAINNSTFRATRYPADYPAFDGKDLSPGEPVELDPLPPTCIIHGDNPVNSAGTATLQGVWLGQNPVEDIVAIENRSGKKIHVGIWDLTGKKIDEKWSAGQRIELDASGWTPGFYVIRMADPQRNAVITEKLVKF